MKTKSISELVGGGKIIFAFTILFVLAQSILVAQVKDFTIYGESLWRYQGYGVENHFFRIRNFYIPSSTEYAVAPDPETNDCPYEIYTTDEMPLSDPDDQNPNNTLKIRPYSVNNTADYRNGVSTLDCYAIQAHLFCSPCFENRTPTEDFPFRYISGDADYDHDVDSDDIDMIQDLILFLRDDLTRNSWEWVHKDEVEIAEERFEEDPYAFVIDYNWPGNEGIILPALSTEEIMADNDKFFTFRTTKVGDIIGSSSTTVANLNTWVCGSGSYLTGGELATRSSEGTIGPQIRKGSLLDVHVRFEPGEPVYAVELPLFFNEADLSLLEVQLTEGFDPRWHRNPQQGTLVFSTFSRDLAPLDVQGGVVARLKLRANREIRDWTNAIRWHPSRPLEVIGEQETSMYADVALELANVHPGELYAAVWGAGTPSDVLYVESPVDADFHLWIRSAAGHQLWETNGRLARGRNTIDLPEGWPAGLYICTLESKDAVSVKWIKY